MKLNKGVSDNLETTWLFAVKSEQGGIWTQKYQGLRGSYSRQRAPERPVAYRVVVMSAFCSCQQIFKAIQDCDVIWC